MAYPARYFDGRIARAREVDLRISTEGLEIHFPSVNRDREEAPGPWTPSSPVGPIVIWQGSKIRLIEDPGDEVILGLENTTSRLIVGDREIVGALKAVAPDLHRRLSLSRTVKLKVATWSAAAVVSAALLVFVVIPLAADRLASMTPEAAKLRTGYMVLDLLDRVFPDGNGYCQSSGGIRALNQIAVRLIRRTPVSPPPRLYVLDTPHVNAFALPGGIVVMTRGLLLDARDTSEIAGVLAHELGHVVHDHPIRALYRDASAAVLIAMVVGADVALFGSLAEHILRTGYSREAERIADAFALESLIAAGISSEGFRGFFERLAADNRDTRLPGILSTHPPTAERLEALGRARRVGERHVLESRQWQQLRDVCRIRGPWREVSPVRAGSR